MGVTTRELYIYVARGAWAHLARVPPEGSKSGREVEVKRYIYIYVYVESSLEFPLAKVNLEI
jgi:hypothetical protein